MPDTFEGREVLSRVVVTYPHLLAGTKGYKGPATFSFTVVKLAPTNLKGTENDA